jgi:hypothetical protein
LLSQENAELVDKIIFHGIIDKIVALYEREQLRQEAILVEIAFCLSNIAAGTSGQIEDLLNHPTAWDMLVTKFLICPKALP